MPPSRRRTRRRRTRNQQRSRRVFDIDEYRVEGADSLPQIDVEDAVYPYLGPGRTPKDIEGARAALEKKYHDKGFQTVSVTVRYQNIQDRYVSLAVSELKVGQVRVKNSKYHDLDAIKDDAPSLRHGVLPEFGAVTKDIVGLNQWPDRRVTPALRAGVTPGTVDVDFNVEDKLPLHASVELNNRQSPSTTDLRFSTTVSYGNLWQLGHSLSFTYQTAPKRPDDMEAFSGSYLARVPGVDWLSLLFYGVDSSSDVALLGDMNVIGPGQIIGARAVITLPSKENFYQSLSTGIDYKHFEQTVALGKDAFDSPITYYPVVAAYSATWQQPEKSLTQLNATVTYGLRGLGSESWQEWDTKRFKATPNFFILSGDLSETYELPRGFQFYGRMGGQLADQPLVSSEEYSLGGEQTVRGYLESSWLGDDGGAATIELRTPNIGTYLQDNLEKSGRGLKDRKVFNDWRLFTFVDAGIANIHEPLPGQQAYASLWSYGVGTTFKTFDVLNGSLALAIPQSTEETVKEGEPRLLFRVWGEF
jgi:hemolysin activation/secretion protein